MSLLIRPESPADISAIHSVTTAAFFNVPRSDRREQFIITALRGAGVLSISLVAEINHGIVGHVAVSPVAISDGATGWFGLGPLSVCPEYQWQGIGSRLVGEAIGLLQVRGAAGCTVLGNPAYYGRFGFKSEAGLVLPDVPAEYFQVLSFGQALPLGTVTYHVAFRSRG
jgi:putative acetyltransferase